MIQIQICYTDNVLDLCYIEEEWSGKTIMTAEISLNVYKGQEDTWIVLASSAANAGAAMGLRSYIFS